MAGFQSLNFNTTNKSIQVRLENWIVKKRIKKLHEKLERILNIITYVYVCIHIYSFKRKALRLLRYFVIITFKFHYHNAIHSLNKYPSPEISLNNEDAENKFIHSICKIREKIRLHLVKN